MDHSEEQGYRGTIVSDIIGITYRQLDYWARTNLIRPSVQEARGSGSQRLYSFEDVVLLHLLKVLLDNGISLQSCRNILDVVRAHKFSTADAFVTVGHGPPVVADPLALTELLQDAAPVLKIVNLGQVVERTRELLAGYPARQEAVVR